MTSAPAGWYPDNHDPSVDRWYDGARWGEQTRPRGGVPNPYGSGGDGRGVRGLATALRVALGLLTVALVAEGVSATWAAVVVGRWLDDRSAIDLTQGRTIDALNLLTSVIDVLLSLVVLVLFICWLYQARGRPVANPAELKMKRGWAIGGWFIPLANLVIPYRCVAQLDRATQSPPPRPAALVGWWWAALLVCKIAGVTARVDYDQAKSSHGFRAIGASLHDAEVALAVSAYAGVVAAVLAMAVVARNTRRIRESDRQPAVPLTS